MLCEKYALHCHQLLTQNRKPASRPWGALKSKKLPPEIYDDTSFPSIFSAYTFMPMESYHKLEG